MKKIFVSMYVLLLSFTVAAQDISIAAMPDTRNENGYYTSLKAAQQNSNDVKTLDIKKGDADAFLSNPDTFPNLETLVVHFSDLIKIQSLNANRNLKAVRIMYSWNLASLPRKFTELPDLEQLTVSSCGLWELPATFFMNKNIEGYCLCYNKLSSLPEIPVENNIRYLNLDINYFSTLSEDFANLKQLEILGLKDCHFMEFPTVLLSLKNLKILDLSANIIKTIPDELGTMPNLEQLYLIRTQVTELPASLRTSGLKRVMMSDKNLTEEQKEGIRQSLPANCELVWTWDLNHVLGSINDMNCGCLKPGYY